MFKFNFPADNCDRTEPESTPEHISNELKSCVQEVEGREIEITIDQHENVNQYRASGLPITTVREFQLIDVKHVEQFLSTNEAEHFESLRTALQKNSDVISGVYEGGLKVWECTIDLLDYLEKNQLQFNEQNVLDLGCGAGLLGIFALKQGASSVHFQDYNAEVLELVTIPNVILNEPKNAKGKTKFFAGDWGSLITKLDSYDVILTSETIYNPENYSKLLSIFEKTIKKNGVIYVAAKHHYFGVGGDLHEFESLLRRDGQWTTSICFCSSEGPFLIDGVKREIMKIVRSTIL
uniref:protein-histidine N-methyltransferase n=1 Tax=Simocephalus serrulatus TaxID=117539 RepID=A0A4Y7NMI2_9CRUS|nr:EOG090X0C09 [Simocephalus serrulatus]